MNVVIGGPVVERLAVDEVTGRGASARRSSTSRLPARYPRHPVPADHSGRHRVEGGDHHRTSSR